MTLPLIYSLQKAKWSDKRRIINTVKNHNENPSRVAEVVQYVQNSGGLDYAEKRMKEYQVKALETLREFPDGEIRQSMERLVDYVITRNK